MTPTSPRILIEPTTGNILIPPALLSDLPLLKRTVIADPALLNQIISLNSTLASAILEGRRAKPEPERIQVRVTFLPSFSLFEEGKTTQT